MRVLTLVAGICTLPPPYNNPEEKLEHLPIQTNTHHQDSTLSRHWNRLHLSNCPLPNGLPSNQ
jgi:hypothetical protein